jgi:hypothetical protein
VRLVEPLDHARQRLFDCNELVVARLPDGLGCITIGERLAETLREDFERSSTSRLPMQ